MAKGNVRVSITAETAGLKRGVDQANRQLGSLNKSVRGFQRLGGALAGAFAVSEVVDFAKQSVIAYEEVIKVNKQTEAVLKSTGHAAGLQKKDILDLASAISRKTAIDDEQIQTAENLLLTFTHIGKKVFPDATRAVVDMSVALGQDFKSSSVQVGKALNDPIKGVTALQRVGVSFTASQKEQIKTLVESGRTLDAQKLILRELGKEFGGSAQKAATPLARLKVAVGNLQESLGKQLYPVVTKVADKLSTFIEQMQSGTGAGGRFAKRMKDLWEGLRPAVKRIGEIAKGIFEFASENPGLTKNVALIATLSYAVKRISGATGIGKVLSTLTGLGGRLLGGGGKGGLGDVVSRKSPVPVFVTNPGWGGTPGGPGKGPNVPPVVTKPRNIGRYGIPGATTALEAGGLALSAGTAAAVIGLIAANRVGRGPLPGGRYPAPSRDREYPAYQKIQVGTGRLGPGSGDPADFSPTRRSNTLRKMQLDDIKATKDFRRQINAAWEGIDKDTSSSIKKIRSTVSKNMRIIKGTLGTESDEGRYALAKNFSDAAGAVRTRMRRAGRYTQEGMDEIRRLLGQALMAFGFSQKQASRYAQGLDPLTGRNSTGGSNKAAGGWIGSRGQAGYDTVPAMLGVGEAVLNRHQQGPVELALRATYGMTLDDLFAKVRRPHYLAGGGKIKDQTFPGGMGTVTRIGQRAFDRADAAAERRYRQLEREYGGLPAGVPGSLRGAAALARQLGLAITSTTGGRHAANSWHYKGRALDVAGSGSAMSRFFRRAYQRYGSHLLELFYDPIGFYVKNGSRVSGAIGGHGDHVHIALNKGGRVRPGKHIATVFGSEGDFTDPYDANDPNTRAGRGYLGDNMRAIKWVFGEPGNTRLGGLPRGYKIAITRGDKTVIAGKYDRNDVALNEGDLDLWIHTARYLNNFQKVGKGPVQLNNVDQKLPLGPVSGGLKALLGKSSSVAKSLSVKDVKKRHEELNKEWLAERRKKQPRSIELEKIAEKGVQLTSGRKEKGIRSLAKLWRDRLSYARRLRSRRRTATLRQRNLEGLQAGIEGRYQVALTTNDPLDDKEAANAGVKLGDAMVNYYTPLAKRDPVRYGGALAEALDYREGWRARGGGMIASEVGGAITDSAGGGGAGTADAYEDPRKVQQEIRDLLREQKERADAISRTSDGALAVAVTNVVTGQIGGRVGLGYQRPSVGGYATY